jgi:large subunit ribosomal protein L21e
MVKRIGGKRRKSRARMRKSGSTKGKISITKYMQTFSIGDSVQLKAEPAVQKGIYHLNFHGKLGVVFGKRGECYIVDMKDGGKTKKIIVHPIHLKRLQTKSLEKTA